MAYDWEWRLSVFEVEVSGGFDFLAPESAALFERSGATPFQHPIWLDRLYRHLAPARDAQPAVVTVRSRGDRQLVMVLPLVRRRIWGLRLIEFADLGVGDYAAPVCGQDAYQTIVSDPGVNKQILDGLKPYDLLRIRHIREDCLPFSHLLESTELRETVFSAHATNLCESFSDWRIKSLNGSFRRYIDRRRRRLERSGRSELTHLTTRASISEALATMRDFRRGRFDDREGRDLLQDPDVFAFYLDVAVSGTQCGLAATYVLSLEDEPIAVIFGLSHRGTFYQLLNGCSYERHKRLSPGHLICESLIRLRIEEGDKKFDFTIGDEPYKANFGTHPTGIYSAWRAGSLAGAAVGRALDHLDWAKPYIRQLVT